MSLLLRALSCGKSSGRSAGVSLAGIKRIRCCVGNGSLDIDIVHTAHVVSRNGSQKTQAYGGAGGTQNQRGELERIEVADVDLIHRDQRVVNFKSPALHSWPVRYARLYLQAINFLSEDNADSSQFRLRHAVLV